VDNRLCCNCCSTWLLENLNLIIIPHPKPYKSHWLNKDDDIAINRQGEGQASYKEI